MTLLNFLTQKDFCCKINFRNIISQKYRRDAIRVYQILRKSDTYTEFFSIRIYFAFFFCFIYETLS